MLNSLSTKSGESQAIGDSTTIKPTQAKTDCDQVEEALAQFEVIRDRRLQCAFDVLPPVIVVVITMMDFIRWYVRGALELQYTSAALAIVVSLLVTRYLFLRFPQTLLIIWRRDLLRSREGNRLSPEASNGVHDRFLEFLEESERQLNHRLSLVLGFLGMLVVVWMLWLFEREGISKTFLNLRTDPFATCVVTIVRLVYGVSGFIGGLVFWRVIVIAIRLRAIGNEFDLNVQIEHPDNCGGLRPIGDLCLVIAYILSPLLLLVGGWLTFINAVDRIYFSIPPSRIRHLVSTFQTLLAPLVTLTFVGFILPLTSIHAAMNRAKLRFQDELDLISQQIHQISTNLLTKADKLSADDGAELEKKIDFLQRVYDRNSKIPTWPISFGHIWRLATTQIAPAIGLGSSGIGLVKTIISLF